VFGDQLIERPVATIGHRRTPSFDGMPPFDEQMRVVVEKSFAAAARKIFTH
jgi:hypothetical protein